MSTGIVVCSICQHECHQDGPQSIDNGWRHCEGGSRMCIGGRAVYPASTADIKGGWCGRDAAFGQLDAMPLLAKQTPTFSNAGGAAMGKKLPDWLKATIAHANRKGPAGF